MSAHVFAILTTAALIVGMAGTQARAQGAGEPTFAIGPNSIVGWGWTANVAVTIDEDNNPENGVLASWSDVQIENTSFNINPDYVPVAGHVVTVADGTYTKVHVVRAISITGTDMTTDTVRGVGTPGWQVQVWIWTPDNGVNRWVTADASTGEWTADFAHVGTQPDEQTTYDITFGTYVQAGERDDDGDMTMSFYRTPNPNFTVWVNGGKINAQEFTPNAAGTLTVDGAPYDVGFDGGGTIGEWMQEGVEFHAGQVLTLTDGTWTKELTLVNLTIVSASIEDDTVSGTADPGTNVQVSLSNQGFRNTTADENGNWLADFSVAQPETQQLPTDVVPGMNIGASVWDGDGDSTSYGYTILNPRFRAYTNQTSGSVSVYGWEWTTNTSGSLTINGGDPQPIDFDEWGNFWYQPPGLAISVGDHIVVTDGSTTKATDVTTLTIDAVDVNADTVSGTAQPDARVEVDLWGQDGAHRSALADGSGSWTADFSVESQPGAGDTFDIVRGTDAEAAVMDPDEDSTARGYHVKNPLFRAYTGQTGQGTWIEGWEWDPNKPVSITINAGTPQSAGTDEWGNFWYQPGDLTFSAGDHVVVTDGTTTKDLTVTIVEIHTVALEADMVLGASVASATLDVSVYDPYGNWAGRRITADGTGLWTADFSIESGPGQNDTFDISKGTDVDASVTDDDGDQTVAGYHVKNPTFNVVTEGQGVTGIGGWEWSTAPITISVTGPGGDWTDTVTPDEWGSFWYQSERLAPLVDQVYTLTDGTTTKVLTIVSITFTNVDFETDVVTGTADPGVLMQVAAWDFHQWGARMVRVDENGNWTADFSTGMGEGEPPIDLRPGINLSATFGDEDGDSTSWGYYVPDPRIIVDVPGQTILGLDWKPSATVDVTVDRPGTTGVDFTANNVPVGYYPSYSLGMDGEVGVSLVWTAFHVRPGDTVTMTNGTTTKSLVVSGVMFDSYSGTTGVATGRATPGESVHIMASMPMGAPAEEIVAADATGNWSIDLKTKLPPEWDPMTASVYAQAIDADDDWTAAFPPNRDVQLQPQTDQIWGDGWTGRVTVSISRPSTGQTYRHTYAAQCRITGGRWFDYPGDYPSCTWERPSGLVVTLGNAWDLRADDVVTVTDAVETVTKTVPRLELESVDYATNTITGFTVPDGFVGGHNDNADAYWGYNTQADADGHFVIHDTFVPIQTGDSGQLMVQTEAGSAIIWWPAPAAANVVPAVHEITMNASAPVTTTATASATFTHSDTGQTMSATWSWGDSTQSSGKIVGTTVTGSHKYSTPGPYTVTLTVSDAIGEGSSTVSYTVLNTLPAVTIAPIPAVELGNAVNPIGTLTHPDAGQTPTATWDWGDGSNSVGTISGTTVTGSHTYTATGSYTVGLTVGDGIGTTTAKYSYVVVYETPGSLVSASGVFTSPAGAYPALPTLNGPASLTVTTKYTSKGVLDGKVTFSFAAAKLSFTSVSYKGLLVDGANAWLTGTGKVNNKTGYGFLVSFYDSAIGVSGADSVRVQIFRTSDGAIVYDTQPGDAATAVATTSLTSGSVVIQP